MTVNWMKRSGWALRFPKMNTGASYEALCEDAATVCTNLADGEMSAPPVSGEVMGGLSLRGRGLSQTSQGSECNVGIWEYENAKLRKCENGGMRERPPRCTCSLSHFLNIPIFSFSYSHNLTLHL